MFLSREIDIKLCPTYTKIHICAILYKSSRFKQIIFNQIRNQSENDDIPQKPENLRFAHVIIFIFFYFAFIIGIIDNIITYSTYIPYYVTRTSANDR